MRGWEGAKVKKEREMGKRKREKGGGASDAEGRNYSARESGDNLTTYLTSAVRDR